ncbi:hypothetical protein [Maridesulfovibrio sp.]|uniref:hypothetical protein n=1 Tax=Maridesulfovibrio sp. TaxID=2795000 RepID=UPI002A1880FB|nr:hypothetical protein [Maridesulfovibrio sp.]
MSNIRNSLAAIFFCTCISLLTATQAAHADIFRSEELVSTQCNSFFDIYDFVFPVLASAVAVNPGSPMPEKIDQASDYVHFYSTPGFNKREKGLGTGDGWRFGATVMLYSGNILCSEQSSLAVMLLDFYFPRIRFRNVQHHTFHELLYDGEWYIIDPYANTHLRNRKGQSATYGDIQKYLNGDSNALSFQANEKDKVRTYLDLFKNNGKSDYSKTFAMNYYSYGDFLGYGLQEFFDRSEVDMEMLSAKRSMLYLLYIRNNICNYIFNSKDRRKAACNIQNYLFSKIKEDAHKGISKNKINYDLFFARGYQLLGRYNLALEEYRKIEPSQEVELFIAQCYYKLDNRAAFNNLKQKLQNNIFYRNMYFILNGKELIPGDRSIFGKFLYF